MSTKHISQLPELLHVNDVTSFNEADVSLFNELFSTLKKYNALNRFGINLLHRHFEVNDDEILVEETDSRARKQLIEPVKVADIPENTLLTTSWRFDLLGNPLAETQCRIEHTSVPPQHVDRRF